MSTRRRSVVLLGAIASCGAWTPVQESWSCGASVRRRPSFRLSIASSPDEQIAPQQDERRRSLRYEKELRDAYRRCGEITKIFSKTFYFGTTFFSEAKKTAVWAIYVWCRRTDDIVDSPLATMLGAERMAEDLEKWEARLDKIWQGEPTDSLDLALADAKRRYPELNIVPYKDMIKGMLMDTPGHEFYQSRYNTWEDLEVYCYRVAGTVGLMTLPVLGTSNGYTLEEAREPALALGIAFQITNILRDVGEDALRGRIYLPLDDLHKFGVSEQQIFDGIVDQNYVNLLNYEIERAKHYYEKARTGIPMLAPEARLAVASSLRVYKAILDKIVENEYDNFRKRAYVSKIDKFLMLPAAYLDILAESDRPAGESRHEHY
ncbi:hypothetical protein CTAYLR_005986 [Chrysophaeum taylorii]|uniref:15-cis-phytoene synthase n=1 Tax=Chrysophaeum taylorii TaxID=2483200 RepID=A0AAD7XEJ9_9STRA|nr:hypothetical protein CTAYLR_005986 [Chrysophaeum taylorii]